MIFYKYRASLVGRAGIWSTHALPSIPPRDMYDASRTREKSAGLQQEHHARKHPPYAAKKKILAVGSPGFPCEEGEV